MNTSQYMDKQIMDLSSSLSNNDFINLHDDQHHITGGVKGVNHPVRPIKTLPNYNIDWIQVDGARAWNSADTKTNTNYSSPDSIEPAKLIVEKDLSTIDASLLSEIDHTVKKYADNLLHAIESVSARLSQLETRSRQIEAFVVELKLSVDNNHGNTDGKLRLVENILREVQDGVQVIKNKQDIMDTQLQLTKLQVPKFEQEIDTHNTTHVDSAHHRASAPLQSHQQFPPVAFAQPPFPLPPPNAPPPPLQQKIPPQVELQDQFPQNPIPSGTQQETYFPSTGQAPENSSQQHQQSAPHQQRQTSIPPPPHQQYHPSPSSLYSQPPPPSQAHPPLPSVNPSQPQPPLIHHPEERHFIALQTYPLANTSQSPSPHPSSGAPVSHQFYAAPPNLLEPSSSRQGPGFASAYGPSTGPGESYPYSGSTVQYGSGSPFKSQQLASPSIGQSGGNGYPQLPTARILPQALPTASAVSSGSSSPRTGNRVPIDDVVDKVTNMGFPRDQVRATVRRLTENGQSVDLNVVLDKLMNGG
ncbi:hypothetical protein AABB24_039984 [Solanum stoloniferum]|uniref:DUF1421 domain-containing protein n=1 Tax=Solanum stoloniferum TaxID=62892 RepID=A0ABD2QT98_9SOLN